MFEILESGFDAPDDCDCAQCLPEPQPSAEAEIDRENAALAAMQRKAIQGAESTGGAYRVSVDTLTLFECETDPRAHDRTARDMEALAWAAVCQPAPPPYVPPVARLQAWASRHGGTVEIDHAIERVFLTVGKISQK